jgi:hypothetical protein
MVWHVMGQEIQHEQDTARIETLDEPLGRKSRVVEVVESQADGSNIKVEEGRCSQCLRVGVRWHTEVALVGMHLIFSQTLRCGAE